MIKDIIAAGYLNYKNVSTPASRSSIRSFTLIELIVVIIIVGILAALGISQYSKMVEKGRLAEARIVIGQIRTLAQQYRLENGSLVGMTNADVNIGTGSDQIPNTCRSTHYFWYQVAVANPYYAFIAVRCSSGGKTPNDLVPYAYGMGGDGISESWQCDTSGGWGASGPCP